MNTITEIIITAFISSIAAAVVAACLIHPLKVAGKRVQEHADTDRAMAIGMRALLWRELQTIHDTATEQGGLTILQRRHLESVYNAYHGLGGNGTGTRLFKDAMNQQILE